MRRLTGMIRPILSTVCIALLLSGCGEAAPDEPGSSDPAGQVTTVDLEGQPSDPVPDPPPRPDGARDEPNDGFPTLVPPTLTPEAERSETGARSMLLTWTRAIELEEFDQAWDLLPDSAQAKWGRAEFAALFEGLQNITVAAPDGRMEGAAGSSYYTAPVTITANDEDGRPVRYEGEVVLRRVNDVPGASEEQLRWHIEQLSLDWTH
ncbi:hypothetical protein [Aurantiacibacter zhengii]|nr:hypothetical protein [Aurantiacibacter zhengii]